MRPFILLLALLPLSACKSDADAGLQGYVEGEYIMVAAPLAGRVTAIQVSRGAQVAQGAPLFALDAERETASVADAEQRASAAAAQLQRQQELRRKGLSSIEQEDAARTQQQAASAQLVQARWQLAQQSVTAPAGGSIEEIYFRIGEWAPAGAPIVSLLPPQNRLLRFFVPEQKLAALKTGDVIHANCDSCGGPFEARISFIAAQAEFAPPVLYSRGQRERLVYRVEAKPDAQRAATLHPGQPLDIELGP